MLEIAVPEGILGIDDNGNIIRNKASILQLEHSLISVAKWEAKWHKPFLGTEKSEEELLNYIECMTINKNVDPLAYFNIPKDSLGKIVDYIKDPMTATTFSKEEEDRSPLKKGSIITSEIIYYWMVTLNIPIELEKWHLERLITLIKVVSIKNSPKKTADKKKEAQRIRELNRQRRAKLNSKG